MKFSVFQISRRGGREKNEDRMGYCYTRDAGLFALADGMGGHPEGEVASQMSLQVLANQIASGMDRLADDDDARLEGRRQSGRERPAECPAGARGVAGGLADDDRTGCGEDAGRSVYDTEHHAQSRRGASNWSATGPTNGFWRDADWLFCRDERWRPVEPGTFPLAHGSAARVGRLRGYGNAIVAPQAAAFVEAFLGEELDRSLRVTFG